MIILFAAFKFLFYALLNKIQRNIHSLCCLLGSQSAFNESAADGFHVFTNFNNVFVGVKETHNTLAPRMFNNRVNIINIVLFYSFGKAVKIVLFKIELEIIAAE